MDGSFGFDRNGTCSKKLHNKRINFSTEYAVRLQEVQIECCDAPRIIRSRDTPETFFYLDPPYVGTDQGHYDGYTQEDFDVLLGLLETLNGKFLLSSYRNTRLAEYTQRNQWQSMEIKMARPMTNRFGAAKNKIEVLTANYPILPTKARKQAKT
jgi:DNA adenine methylase